MSRPASWSALPAAAFFVILVTLASPAGWPRYSSGSGDLQGSLGEMESDMISRAAFHKKVEESPPPETAVFCGECHARPAHAGEGAGAAFLNHHATVFDCLVCHWAKVSGEQPDLVWDRLPLKGGDAGEEGEADLFFRLADPLEEEERGLAALRGEVIEHQECFDRGPGCGDCHREGRLGAYSRPGMSAGEEASLEALPAIFLLAKGDKWYFPQRQ